MSVKGPLELDSLMANGNLDLKDMIVYGESLNTGKINLDLKKSILKVNEFELKKIKGKLQGSASINLQKNNFEVAALIDNLDLLEIDFYKNLGSSLTGQIYGQFNLNNTKNFIQGNGDLKLLNSRSSGYAVGDSLIDLRIRDKIIQLEGGLFDQKVDFESTLDLNEKKDKKSLLRLDLNFPEINQLIGIIWGHNLRSPSTLGSMIGQLKGVFDIEDIQRGDFEFFVKEFELKRKDIQMVSNPGPAIIVKGGKIEKWHLVINDSENYIESNGYGDFSDEYNIRTVSKMSASLLEIISPNMRTVSGQIDNVFSLSDYKGKKNRLIKSEGKNLLVDIVGAPGRISDLKYNAKFTEGSLLIESLTGKFAGGDLNMNGEIDFKTQFPKLNLVLEIENSNLQLFSKSNLILSSQLWLSGSKLPYLLSGNVTVHTGQILDELTELKTGGGVSTAYGKYAPKQVFSDPLELFTSELEISITRGLTIKNSLAEMIFRGSAEVVGKLNAPEVLGSFRIIPGSGRFYFKSNDFILKKGDIIFRKADGFSPYFDFLGVSNIASYDVSLGIFGTIEKYDLQILAEPYLSQNDIFSLLALGYTTDSSQVVDEQARQNLASLGIGSLILDRFQIGQGLKSNFGLNVSLSPELVDNDQASLLQGRTGSNANTTSKTSTTTKVKIQKEISKSLNLSVSSTLGGSIEQKQEMNLEYEFNRNFSVLGVYELRENDEGQETAAPDSVGADLKFKRTFKWH
jgi:translocation and assembly module TamB